MCKSLKAVISDSNKKNEPSSDDRQELPEEGEAESLLEGSLDITEERVSTETNLEQLRSWATLLGGDWEQYELVEKIEQRMRDLESGGGTVADTTVIAESTTVSVIAPIELTPEVTAPPVPPELSVLAKHQIKKFCILCAGDQVDPFRIVEEIKRASKSPASLKAGFLAFMEGMALPQVLQLAQCHDSLLACTRTTINLDEVLGLVDEGLLTVSRITYADNPRVAGSVYVFSFAILPGRRLSPEWHVHWGPQNKVAAASFKNLSERKKKGPHVRTVTDNVTNAKMQMCISPKGLWGTVMGWPDWWPDPSHPFVLA